MLNLLFDLIKTLFVLNLSSHLFNACFIYTQPAVLFTLILIFTYFINVILTILFQHLFLLNTPVYLIDTDLILLNLPSNLIKTYLIYAKPTVLTEPSPVSLMSNLGCYFINNNFIIIKPAIVFNYHLFHIS